jgi:hypothetical protein
VYLCCSLLEKDHLEIYLQVSFPGHFLLAGEHHLPLYPRRMAPQFLQQDLADFLQVQMHCLRALAHYC